MRGFKIFLSLFAFAMLSAPSAIDSAAGGSRATPRLESEPGHADIWVFRLAGDFSIIQSKIADMIVHDDLSARKKERLKLIEKTLRDDVMKIATAALKGDHDTVHRLLPEVARQVRQQIIILIVNDDVIRRWVAVRSKAGETIT